jgi:hypothetical protein
MTARQLNIIALPEQSRDVDGEQWLDSSLERLTAVAHHEAGHIIDDLLGIRGNADILDAYMTDMAAIFPQVPGMTTAQLETLNYMTQQATGIQETIAELFADIHGHNTAAEPRIVKQFSHTRAVLQRILDIEKL